MDKRALASQVRDKRNSFSVEQRIPWDKLIHDSAVQIAETHKVIGIYAAFNNEVDTYGIIETLLWDSSKVIVLPRIEEGQMNFYRIESLQDLQKGHFGVLEPIGNELMVPDIMLTPLSAFNSSLHRIGYGKGYYDKYFAKHPCFKAGLAYDFQKINEDFQDKTDIALDVIITEKKVYYDKTI